MMKAIRLNKDNEMAMCYIFYDKLRSQYTELKKQFDELKQQFEKLQHEKSVQ